MISSTETNCDADEVYNILSLRCDCRGGYSRNLTGNCVLTETHCETNEVYNILSLNCDCKAEFERNNYGDCVLLGTKIFLLI